MKKAKLVELKSGEENSGDYVGAIGVVEEIPPEEVIKVLQGTQVAHVVQKSGIAYENELAFANSMSGNLEQFLNDPLGLILGSGEVAYPSLLVQSQADESKQKTLEAFEEFLKSLRGARKIRDAAIMMADELFTNAVKPGGFHKLSAASLPKRPGTIEFFASADDKRLVFGCRDSYGELGFSQVLNRIKECFENGMTQAIDNGAGGAGIGSYMVFSSCISYYCGVEKGKRTVVCVALPMGSSAEDLISFPKNIHLRSA